MPRINLNNTPFLAAVLPLMAGIVLFGSVPRPLPLIFWIIAGVVIAATVMADIILKQSLPLICTGFLWLGFTAAWIDHREAQVPRNQRLRFISRIENIPAVKGRWQSAESIIIAYKDSTLGWQAVSEKTVLSVDTSQSVGIGETITYDSKLYTIDSSYGRYMANHGVFSRSYTYRIDKLRGDTTTWQRIDIWRHRMSEKLNRIDTSSMTAALTLGDRQELSRTLRNDYTRSGAAHLLSVSGLHVGIIFMILNLAVGWLRIYRRGQIAVGCLVIAILWGYAAVTGMSPPVLRAVIMFTLFQISIMAARGGTALNILAISAFLLLLWNPQYFYDVGFQMSYMAMVGITTLYRPMYSLLDPKSWPIRWLWGLTVVSITAQLGVAPLVAYYFGQIQLVGILINPIVWFTVPVVIVGGFAYLLLGWQWIGSATGWVAEIQNSIVGWTASHWWVTIDNIKMPLWLLLLMYAALIALIVWINNYRGVRKTTRGLLRAAVPKIKFPCFPLQKRIKE